MKITELRDSRISPREFELRLHERVEPRLSVLSAWSPRYFVSQKPFYGIFTKTTFVLQRKKRFAHWLQPLAYGDMVAIPTGIRVHIAWRTHPGSRFFQALAVLLACLLVLTHAGPALVAGLIVTALVIPIAGWVQLADSKRALENFLRPAQAPAPVGNGSVARLKDKK